MESKINTKPHPKRRSSAIPLKKNTLRPLNITCPGFCPPTPGRLPKCCQKLHLFAIVKVLR